MCSCSLKKKYLSFFTHIVRGPFDDYLIQKGEITIQLMNQVEEIFEYNDDTPEECAEKVSMIDKRLTRRWGNPQFIRCARSNMEKYLKNDYIKVCVVNAVAH